jgi:hypothetical protein
MFERMIFTKGGSMFYGMSKRFNVIAAVVSAVFLVASFVFSVLGAAVYGWLTWHLYFG